MWSRLHSALDNMIISLDSDFPGKSVPSLLAVFHDMMMTSTIETGTAREVLALAFSAC